MSALLTPSKNVRSLRKMTRCLNRGNDVGVSSATADVAVHALFDVVVGRAYGLGLQRDCGHDLARGAVAALVCVVFDERDLHGMQVVWRAQAFNCRDLIDRVHDREREARVHPLTVYMHSAGTALSVIAALLGAGEVQILAETVEQRRARIEIHRVLLSIYLESYWEAA